MNTKSLGRPTLSSVVIIFNLSLKAKERNTLNMRMANTWWPWRLLTIQSIWVVLPKVTVCTDPFLPRQGDHAGEQNDIEVDQEGNEAEILSVRLECVLGFFRFQAITGISEKPYFVYSIDSNFRRKKSSLWELNGRLIFPINCNRQPNMSAFPTSEGQVESEGEDGGSFQSRSFTHCQKRRPHIPLLTNPPI